MSGKKKLNGQFFTTNSDYILRSFSNYIKNKEVTDPFAGNRDLIKWAKKNKVKDIKGFDVDPNYVDNEKVYRNDSINNPKNYKFVLTNPPYLHKNKANKEVKDKYFEGGNSHFEDLYQLSINSVMNSEEGILIVPLNFLSASNSEKIRRIFFNKFKIVDLNIFLRQVFEDTTYNVISFYYKEKGGNKETNKIKATIYPDRKERTFVLKEKYGWRLGGRIISEIDSQDNKLGVYRLTEDHIAPGEEKIKLAYNNIKDIRNYSVHKSTKNLVENNILLLRAIDSKTGRKIQLEDIRKYGVKGLIGKSSSRNMAHLIFKEDVSIKEQEKLIKLFNGKLDRERNKYFSLFLTNFRDNGRKRISFSFSYKLANYVYLNKLKHDKKQSILF